MTDFYSTVPKGLQENLVKRVEWRTRAAKDAGFRRAVITACKHDFLYFLNGWSWLYEPRPRFGSDGRKLPTIIPFITWPHQDPVIREVRKHLGTRDIGIEKSRGEGMSWIGILLAMHDWLFDPGSKVGLVSNTEKKADDPNNMDSLGAKIDWELVRLPKWMAGEKDRDYKRNLADHSWVNLRNASQINAFAATSDAGRAGRYKWFLPDELAFWERGQDSKFMTSIRGSTESRLVISTPNGNEGEYYQYMHTPSNVVRLTLDWKDNPTRNRGLYTLVNDKPVAVDAVNNPLLPEYAPPSEAVLTMLSRLRNKGFTLDKRKRSAWYDNECDRADSTPQSIAQELDRDYGGSMYRVFGTDFIETANKGVTGPKTQGILSYHPETLKPEFDPTDRGQLLVWCPLDVRRLPPRHQYAVGCDVSTGLGGSYTSNSVACVVDFTTMEQVAEFVSNSLPPSDFADYSMALAKWFFDAYLIWEHNGPGAVFTKRVQTMQYANAYRRKQQFKNSVKRTSDLGWWTTGETKEAMFGEFLRTVRSSELTLRSKMLVDECGQYVRLGSQGEICHVLSGTTDDDSSRGKAHGDRVIACCVALQAVRDRPLASQSLVNESLDNPPMGTLAWREKFHREALADEDSVWDDRTCDDMAAGERLWSNSTRSAML